MSVSVRHALYAPAITLRGAGLIVVACLVTACGGDADETGMKSADPVQRGAALIRHYGCGSCHHIPGIPSADGNVGPPLDAIASRAYLGGVLPNHFDSMVSWLLAPQEIDPRSAMPDVGLNEQEARDIATYLYTLNQR